MLKKLFGSGARVKLLKQFLLNSEEEYFIRELTRILDEQINSLRRELENLENIGLLKSKERNRKKYYYINQHFALLNELTSIFRKSDESYADMMKKMNKLGDIDLVVLTGEFIGKEKDLDLFVVGDVESADVEAFMKLTYPDQVIRLGVMKKDDFLYRVTLRDKFVLDLFKEHENIILKNKLKKDTAPLFDLA